MSFWSERSWGINAMNMKRKIQIMMLRLQIRLRRRKRSRGGYEIDMCNGPLFGKILRLSLIHI